MLGACKRGGARPWLACCMRCERSGRPAGVPWGGGRASGWLAYKRARARAGACAQVMQDWLAERKLDRKALAALAANVAAVEAYADHVKREVLPPPAAASLRAPSRAHQ